MARLHTPQPAASPGSDRAWITFDNVTLRVRTRRVFSGLSWKIQPDQNWLVLGPNGSGKSTLMQAIVGETPVVGGSLRRHNARAMPKAIGHVSFERHQRIIAREQGRDEARFFSGNLDSHQTTAEFIARSLRRNAQVPSRHSAALIDVLQLQDLLDRPLRALSTGEIRKVMIAQAVMQSQGLVLLDEPFEGLDTHSRDHLAAMIERLIEQGVRVMLATHRIAYALSAFTHVIGLKDCAVFCQGRREAMLTPKNLSHLYAAAPGDAHRHIALKPKRSAAKPNKPRRPLIDIRNACVRYGDHSVFQNLSWKFMPDQNWAVVGPNGAGKSTLLRLISADHPQAYANQIYLFGRRRGTGESIWEIKQRMGIISSEFQIRYRKPLRALEVILSGFFDSVGLYRRATNDQRATARQWSQQLDLSALEDRRFDHLSYGEQRMTLLARAMVKSPDLLILDEPCQGLDPSNRKRILALIDRIGGQSPTRLLYVTHQPTEMPACITHVLDLQHNTSRRLD